MKKLFITAVALLCLSGTAVAQRHVEFLWRGFYLTGDVSYATNLNSSNESGLNDTVSALMPSFSVGYQFRKEAAVGMGFSYLADPTGAFTQIPIYSELRSHFMRSRLTPYGVLQVGYTLPVGTSSEPPSTKITEGGFYVGFDFGARYAVSRTVAFAAHVGLKVLMDNHVQRSDALNVPMLDDAVSLYLLTGGITFYLGNK